MSAPYEPSAGKGRASAIPLKRASGVRPRLTAFTRLFPPGKLVLIRDFVDRSSASGATPRLPMKCIRTAGPLPQEGEGRNLKPGITPRNAAGAAFADLTGCGKRREAVILRGPPPLLPDDEGPLRLLDF